jgi:hypothetical protein
VIAFRLTSGILSPPFTQETPTMKRTHVAALAVLVGAALTAAAAPVRAFDPPVAEDLDPADGVV